MAEVLIIGAGISGLTLGRELLRKGHAVTIIEGRDRVGGRIHTLENKFSCMADAGAEFIHGQQPITLRLLEEAGLEKTLIRGKFYTISKDELEKGDMLDDHWKKLLTEMNKLEVDVTLADFLRTHFSGNEFDELRERATQYAEGFDIADINRVSTFALREEWSHNDDAHQYHLENGYGSLIGFLQNEIIHSGGQILLSEPVETIHWKEKSVEIRTKTGKSFVGQKVVISVPLGVLQKKVIRFIPSLQEHEAAIDTMGFGGVIKFQVEFKEALWESGNRKLKDLAFVFSDAEIPTWWSQLPDKTPFLTGWFSGPRAFEPGLTKEVLYRKALQSLQYIFRCSQNEIESSVVNWHLADWVNDEFSFGAYSYPTIGSPEARKLLSAPVNDTLYFMGEALYEGTAMGTVEAALTSAMSVSQKII